MATPTNLPASFVSGNILTAAQQNGLRGAFRIMQVIQGSTTTQTSSTSTTWVNTALSASITPQSTSSKILVMVSGSGAVSTSGTDAAIRLTRDQPSAPTVLSSMSAVYASNGGVVVSGYSFIYLDSPASTSAITYRTQLSRGAGTGVAYDEVNGALLTITLMEVSA